jgi:hypothetical protein
VLDQRGQLLRAALGFAWLPRPPYDRALWALRTWLDSWSGIGRIALGMHRQGFDLQLTQYDERGWRATFYTTGMEHSPTSATGTGKGAHALGTRLTRSAASLARWARVARIGEKYAPGWGLVECRRCERPNRVQRLHLFPPVTGRYPMLDAPPISTESSQIRVR